MHILTIRTDKPEAEIALYRDDKQIAEEKWEAHRALAETIHLKIKKLLEGQGLSLGDIQGIVSYKGPGSFTGLRIGMSVANALAYGLSIAVVSTQGNDWQTVGLARIKAGEDEVAALPEYGGQIHITQPRK